MQASPPGSPQPSALTDDSGYDDLSPLVATQAALRGNPDPAAAAWQAPESPQPPGIAVNSPARAALRRERTSRAAAQHRADEEARGGRALDAELAQVRRDIAVHSPSSSRRRQASEADALNDLKSSMRALGTRVGRPQLSLQRAPTPPLDDDFDGPNLDGRVLFNGWLKKRSGGGRGALQKEWEARWFVVRDGEEASLSLYREHSAGATEQPLKLWSLEDAVLWMTGDEFSLVLPSTVGSEPTVLYFASNQRDGNLAVVGKFVDVVSFECGVEIGRAADLPPSRADQLVVWEHKASVELQDQLRLVDDARGGVSVAQATASAAAAGVRKGMRVEAVEGRSVLGLPLSLLELRIKAAAAGAWPEAAEVCFGLVDSAGGRRLVAGAVRDTLM